MLIRFSVENFRSFKDRQSLYLNAVKTCKEWNDENTAEESGVRAVRSAVVYGANASGKTNLFIALLRMMSFMFASVDFDKKKHFLYCEPFALSQGVTERPMSFEIEFTKNLKHFVYGFSICMINNSWESYEVTKEWLIGVEKKRRTPYFLRERRIGEIQDSFILRRRDGKGRQKGRDREEDDSFDLNSIGFHRGSPDCQRGRI